MLWNVSIRNEGEIRERERELVCVSEIERERDCVCERERVCVCVRERKNTVFTTSSYFFHLYPNSMQKYHFCVANNIMIIGLLFVEIF